jgi:hypothetical protein
MKKTSAGVTGSNAVNVSTRYSINANNKYNDMDGGK